MFRLPNVAVLVPLHFKNKVTVKIPYIKVEASRKKIFYQTQYLPPPANIYMFNFSRAALKLTTRSVRSKVVTFFLPMFPSKPFGHVSSSHYSTNLKFLYLF